MRFRLVMTVAAALAGLAACTKYDVAEPGGELGAPSDLRYQLIPSGDPDAPEGILLSWAAPNDDRVTDFVVYSRASTSDAWHRRASTTSSTFHDVGIPHLQYYVSAEDDAGNESRGSNTITVDERLRLQAPSGLLSISLDRAIQLAWSANARLSAPANGSSFDYYRLYSALYNIDTGFCDATSWVLEGTTVSEDFLVTGLANGVPRCFAVSAISGDGHESLWSGIDDDTPRYDARNVIVDAYEAAAPTSGFRFFGAAGPTFGDVLGGDRTDIDFRIERRAGDTLWIVPRNSVKMTLYGSQPVTDLTSIDIAPAQSTFGTAAWMAVPGYAYVFEIPWTDGFVRYGAIRVTHISRDFMIVDWAYQSDPGNPELRRVTRTPRGGV